MQDMLDSLCTGGEPAQKHVCVCSYQVSKLSWTFLRSGNISLGILPRKMFLMALLSDWDEGGAPLSDICLSSFKIVLRP